MTQVDAGARAAPRVVFVGRDRRSAWQIGVGWTIARSRSRSPPICARLVDAVLIKTVLINLLENAVRYTPPHSPLEIGGAAYEDAVGLVGDHEARPSARHHRRNR
ncbi:MAG: hypothetical protein U0527_04910 [Candidatus Eisenbacteria bacterium]